MAGASTMQIAEMLIHGDFQCESNMNKTGSRFGFLSLQVIQPIISFIAAFLFSYRAQKEDKTYFYNVLLFYVIAILAYNLFTAIDWPIDDLAEWCTTERNDCGHGDACDIKWDWAPNEAYQYFPYWITVFVIPSLMLYHRTWGVVATIALMPTLMWLVPKLIGASASCFWAPFLAVLIVLLAPLVANGFKYDEIIPERRKDVENEEEESPLLELSKRVDL